MFISTSGECFRAAARALLFVVSLGVSQVCAAADSDEVVNRPEIKVGDRWTYRTPGLNIGKFKSDYLEVVVTFVKGDTILYTTTARPSGEEHDATSTADLNYIRSPVGSVFRPNSGQFKFPMTVGMAYESEFDSAATLLTTVPEGTWFHGKLSTKVAAWEDIDAPAGRFRTLRLEQLLQLSMPNTTQKTAIRSVIWYAPEVRRFVRQITYRPNGEVAYTIELVTYALQ